MFHDFKSISIPLSLNGLIYFKFNKKDIHNS